MLLAVKYFEDQLDRKYFSEKSDSINLMTTQFKKKHCICLRGYFPFEIKGMINSDSFYLFKALPLFLRNQHPFDRKSYFQINWKSLIFGH